MFIMQEKHPLIYEFHYRNYENAIFCGNNSRI